MSTALDQGHLNWGQANRLHSTYGSSSEVPPAFQVYRKAQSSMFSSTNSATLEKASPASLFLPKPCRIGMECSLRSLLWALHSSQAAHYSLDVSKKHTIQWRSPIFSAKQTERDSSLWWSLTFCSKCTHF